MRSPIVFLIALVCAAAPVGAAAADVDGACLVGQAPTLFGMTRVEATSKYRSVFLQAINAAGDTAGVLTRHDRNAQYWLIVRGADGTVTNIPSPKVCARTTQLGVLRYNVLGQLLLRGSVCTGQQLWDPSLGWRTISADGHAVLWVHDLNDRGEVAGAAMVGGKQLGFVTTLDGATRWYDLGDTTSIDAINNAGDVAATVTHQAPDRSTPDTSAVLIRSGQAPQVLGDRRTRTRKAYEDGDRPVHSQAYALNAHGALAGASQEFDRFDSFPQACEWTPDGNAACARPFLVPLLHIAGLDDRGRMVFTRGGSPHAFIFLPETGDSWPLDEVVQGGAGAMAAGGVNASGSITGWFDRPGKGPRSSYILTPLD